MSSKKTEKKESKILDQALNKVEEIPVKIHKAARNFFFAGKNWFEGQEVNLPEKDLQFLLSKGVIH